MCVNINVTHLFRHLFHSLFENKLQNKTARKRRRTSFVITSRIQGISFFSFWLTNKRKSIIVDRFQCQTSIILLYVADHFDSDNDTMNKRKQKSKLFQIKFMFTRAKQKLLIPFAQKPWFEY